MHQKAQKLFIFDNINNRNISQRLINKLKHMSTMLILLMKGGKWKNGTSKLKEQQA